MSKPNLEVMKSYVWHEGRCFFVSTIERDSSAAIIPPPRYNETIVWEYDWDKREMGAMIHQEEDTTGSIYLHVRICQRLHDTGIPQEPEQE
jgi:hypothetical protein